MAGTKAGGLKATITNKERHGADFYSKIGKKGGSAFWQDSANKGFASMDKERLSEVGRRGGKQSVISKRERRITNARIN